MQGQESREASCYTSTWALHVPNSFCSREAGADVHVFSVPCIQHFLIFVITKVFKSEPSMSMSRVLVSREYGTWILISDMGIEFFRL